MLFSPTLDAGVNTLIKQFLHNPVTHEADSVLSPVGEMDHHVLRIEGDHRTQVLAELAAAPGNTIIFIRTKHGAKKLAKQLLGLGVPTVDLHGTLSQNARNKAYLHRSGRTARAGNSGTVVTPELTR